MRRLLRSSDYRTRLLLDGSPLNWRPGEIRRFSVIRAKLRCIKFVDINSDGVVDGRYY
jgi:hypothetical protein